MPIGGKLVLKGGATLKGVGKKSSKKKHKHAENPDAAAGADEAAEQQLQQPDDKSKPPKADAKAINVMSGKSYEQEFELEQQRMAKPAVKTTPWGSTYRAAPEILHGYDRKVRGDTASERLDMRAATKADKFCK